MSTIIKGAALGVALLAAWIAGMLAIFVALDHFVITFSVAVIATCMAGGVKIMRYWEPRP